MKWMLTIWVVGVLTLGQGWAFDQEHALWTTWLQKYTVSVAGPATQVDYARAKGDPLLDTYLDALAKVKQAEFKTWENPQQMAFLINAYNAATVKLIIERNPAKSIRQIGGWLRSPWKIAFVNLLEQTLTLDNIEHDILRKEYPDPRIHFAVVCASIGCPRLQQIAFTGSNLEALLDAGTREFLADHTRNKVEWKSGVLIFSLSKIFDWYQSDFGSQQDLAQFVLKYLDADERHLNAVRTGNYKITYMDYDWDLNKVGG
jgi:hypothetical protein